MAYNQTAQFVREVKVIVVGGGGKRNFPLDLRRDQTRRWSGVRRH